MKAALTGSNCSVQMQALGLESGGSGAHSPGTVRAAPAHAARHVLGYEMLLMRSHTGSSSLRQLQDAAEAAQTHQAFLRSAMVCCALDVVDDIYGYLC